MITNLEQLYFNQLRDLFSAESQLIAALPDLTNHVTDPELRRTFQKHMGETRNHRARLQDIFCRHGLNPGGEECEAVRGLIRETRKHVGRTRGGVLRDAVLIAATNRIEHYEIAGYGTAKAFAECLGYGDDADILGTTLGEESDADEAFTKLATGGMFSRGLNEMAAAV
ncbi:ferritin-like domain-containing protein [Luteolibacter sp. Populi]|uniref:ferritin-like domain-containing protein n=1 Tax=Luteolibacter sp. Populi TaxID=3230487 RepID=UPI003466977D